jgi:hypothetical protein
VTADLRAKAADLTFVAAHEQLAAPLSRDKLSALAKQKNLDARLVLTGTQPIFKGADRTSDEIAQGLPGRRRIQMLGIHAALVNGTTDKILWVALVSLPAADQNIDQTYESLAHAVAEKVIASGVLAVE